MNERKERKKNEWKKGKKERKKNKYPWKLNSYGHVLHKILATYADDVRLWHIAYIGIWRAAQLTKNKKRKKKKQWRKIVDRKRKLYRNTMYSFSKFHFPNSNNHTRTYIHSYGMHCIQHAKHIQYLYLALMATWNTFEANKYLR